MEVSIYHIQKGDTLETIAKKYNITAEELRRYHNTYAELSELLGREITHQKELLIPKQKKDSVSEESQKEIDRKKVAFAPGNKLVYSPVNTHYKYGVIITLENGEEKNELKYEASVKWLQTYNDDHIFEIDRTSKIYINEEEANDVADLLAYETSKVLFPMHLMVDEDGNWREIATYNKYPERWEAVKKHLEKAFEGEVVEHYFQKIEKIFKTPEQINFYMTGDFFLRTLFLGYCINYGKDYSAEKYLTFPVIENGIEPRYKMQTKVDPYLDEYNLINVEMEGVLDDERSQADFINENPFAFEKNSEKQIQSFGDFSIQAFLNPNSCIPEAIHLECNIHLNETKKVSVVIANLSETGSIPVRNRQTSVFQKEIVPETNFWGGIKEFFKEMNDPAYREEKASREIAENLKKYNEKR